MQKVQQIISLPLQFVNSQEKVFKTQNWIPPINVVIVFEMHLKQTVEPMEKLVE